MSSNIKLYFNSNYILIILLIFSSIVLFSNCNRIKSRIYKPIESNYFCFRRLSATNQIGCNSKEGGNVGVVYMVNNENDMNYVLKSGQHFPYIAVITAKHLNLESMNRFKQSSDRISGVIVLNISPENRTSELSSYSPDKSCPNERFSLYSNDSTHGQCRTQQWNSVDGSHNNGLMFGDWPFPIFFIKDDNNIDDIKDCFNRFGGPDWPLCSIELKAPMNGAKDSSTCMRRTVMGRNAYLSRTYYCDPLGGNNIFSTLFKTSKNDSIDDKSIIVLSSRLDSFSMFDNISPGADSALTSVVTLLATAQTLNKYKLEIEQKSNKSNVLFALFDGEAFDYIGSGRTVYDMKAGKFPVDPNSDINLPQIRSHHFSHFIELNQLAPHQNGDRHRLWIHKDLKPNHPINELTQLLKKYSQDIPELEINSIADDRPLPPSSLQSFLKNDRSLAGVVIANHEKQYSNLFYNSIYDDIINVNKSSLILSKSLINIVKVISNSIYELLTKQKKNLVVNETTVEELLDCYLSNSVCDLFKYVNSPDQQYPKEKLEAYATYVGVYATRSASYYSRTFTHLLLSYLTGEEVSVESSEVCNKLNTDSKSYNFYWMAGPSLNGTCIKSQALKTAALSPAFINDGEVKDTDLYSTWTESQWDHTSARLFIRPSPLQQWLTLMTGLIILLISFIIIYFMDKKSSILFETCDDVLPRETLTVAI